MKLPVLGVLKCLISLLYLGPLVKCEVYTAIVDMLPLLRTVGDAANAIDAYIELEEERLLEVKRLRNIYKNVYDKAMEDPLLFLANPVNAYLVVKHLTLDWNTVRNIMHDQRSHDPINDLELTNSNFPVSEDFKGAADALFRLQDTYLLTTSQIAEGQIKGANISSQMTASDCFELGFEAYHKHDYYHAGLWLEEALSRIGNENQKSIKKTIILEYLAHFYFLVKDRRKAVKLTQQVMVEDPNHLQAHSNLQYYMSHLTPDEMRQVASDDPELDERSLSRIHLFKLPMGAYFDDYSKLCRGEKIKTPMEEKDLYCRYTTNNDSYLLLQPVKEEVLSLQPRIVVYHDIISDKDSQLFIDMALPTLATATVVNSQTAVLETASYRVSKSAWLEDDKHPRIVANTRLVSALLGLNSVSSEQLHVITYGIGGHYNPHFDFRREHEVDNFAQFNIGNRIATWIYYLSDVDAGGSTVFPDIGVEIKAKKGSAVAWFNLFRNGTGDLDTKHAACPVLAGTKWIANKWYHEYGNEFQMPCALDRRL